jgi:hypothetical protein
MGINFGMMAIINLVIGLLAPASPFTLSCWIGFREQQVVANVQIDQRAWRRLERLDSRTGSEAVGDGKLRELEAEFPAR